MGFKSVQIFPDMCYSIYSPISAFHRGYMRDCYHSYCDESTNINIGELNYDFVSRIAQALVYSVADLAMEKPENSKCKLRHFVEPTTTTTATTTTTSSFTTPAYMNDLIDNNLDTENIHNDVLQFGSDSTDTELNILMEPESDMISSNTVSEKVLELRKLLDEVKAKTADLQASKSWFSSQDAPVTYHIGTQINIGSLNLGMGSSNDGKTEPPERPNVILGSGDVNPDILSKIIHSYYNSDHSDVIGDRRRYKGKHKNSPMLIQLMRKQREDL